MTTKRSRVNFVVLIVLRVRKSVRFPNYVSSVTVQRVPISIAIIEAHALTTPHERLRDEDAVVTPGLLVRDVKKPSPMHVTLIVGPEERLVSVSMENVSVKPLGRVTNDVPSVHLTKPVKMVAHAIKSRANANVQMVMSAKRAEVLRMHV